MRSYISARTLPRLHFGVLPLALLCLHASPDLAIKIIGILVGIPGAVNQLLKLMKQVRRRQRLRAAARSGKAVAKICPLPLDAENDPSDDACTPTNSAAETEGDAEESKVEDNSHERSDVIRSAD